MLAPATPQLRDTSSVRPRFATPRSPERPSYGAAIAKVSQAYGKTPQPWQQLVWDVGTELLPDGSWAYDLVVVHVQRQGGKTTLVLPLSLHRQLIKARCKTWFTAQKRQDARDTWLDCAELVALSPLAQLLTVRKSNGSEALTAVNGSTFRVFAPTEDGLHGKANELVTVDEGWAFDGVEGAGLEGAIIPTFATTGGQLWLPSTAGTAASTWFRSKVNRGRAAVEAGTTTGIAHFEWSLDAASAERVVDLLTAIHRTGEPEAAVAKDPTLARALDEVCALVLAAHPGQYVGAAAVRKAALSMSPGEFARAYGNHWTLTADRVIADHDWKAAHNAQLQPPEPGQLRLSFDVTGTRSHGAIAGAWRDVDGRPAVDVLDARPGTSWLVERIEQLARRYRVDEVGCDGAGPALDIADELERRGVVKVRRISGREYVAACAGFLAAVEAHQLHHRANRDLDASVAAAARRELGDTWVWGRRQSAGPIAALVAATVALWTYDHRTQPIAAPVVVSTRPAPRTPQLVGAPSSTSSSTPATYLSV